MRRLVSGRFPGGALLRRWCSTSVLPAVVPGHGVVSEPRPSVSISEADKELFRAAMAGKTDVADRAAAEIDGVRRLGGAGIGPVSGEMMLAFTCNQCETRSVKRFTKRSYHHGIVIVECPGCKNKHLIADHLGWFEDGKKTVVDILRERGEEVVHIQTSDLFTMN